ncbi:MAG: hypothetical protein LJE89_07545 [Deltaproteobacteria bacterium]|nr:hypothetical protein [Deltaproteobacteria bacterium]
MCRGRWFILFIVLILTHLGCESIKGTGLKELEGQSVFNRVSFRSSEANKIKSANPFSGGIFIPPGTECSIKAISIKEIKFIATGENYALTGWRMGYGGVNTRVSFYKFFVQDKEAVGLDRVNPDFRAIVLSGSAEVGMTKGEVLLSLGYPAHLSRKNPTADDSRAAILADDNWYYLEDKRKEVLLQFKGGVLTKIVEE